MFPNNNYIENSITSTISDDLLKSYEIDLISQISEAISLDNKFSNFNNDNNLDNNISTDNNSDSVKNNTYIKSLYIKCLTYYYANIYNINIQSYYITETWRILITNISDRCNELELEDNKTLKKNNINDKIELIEESKIEVNLLEDCINFKLLYLLLLVTANDINFSSIYGNDDLKLELFQDIIYPRVFQLPKPLQTFLFYGPPGTGKTFFARAIVGQINLNTNKNYKFLFVSPSSILSKWIGESEKAMKNIFDSIKSSRPCVLFFDEIDSLTQSRSSNDHMDVTSHRVLTEFILNVTKLNSYDDVIVIAATNCLTLIDEAVLRRFEKKLLFPLPDERNRFEIMNQFFQSNLIQSLSSTDLEAFISNLNNYSTYDILLFCEEALRVRTKEHASRVYSNGILGIINTDICVEELRDITMNDLISVLNNKVKK